MTDIARNLRGHVPALDGLRGVAILLVLLHAFDLIIPNSLGARLADMALNFGWVGVQLFFVLSGFLITGILLDTAEDKGYYRNFFARRFLRIFPLYYGVLLVAFVIVPAIWSVPTDYGKHQLWLWIYLENFSAPFGRSENAFPHFWSLCVEEQFYLLWPLTVHWLGRRGIIIFGALLVALAIISRVWVRHQFPGEIGEGAAYVFTNCRMDALAIGAMAAAMLRNIRLRTWVEQQGGFRAEILGVGLIIFAAVAGQWQRTGAFMQTAGYSILAIGFACLLVAALQPSAMTSRLLAWRPMRRVGTYSYAMYVFHAPLHLYVGLPLLAWIGAGHGVFVTLAYTLVMGLATFVLGALSYHLYERHFLTLKSHFVSKRVEANS